MRNSTKYGGSLRVVSSERFDISFGYAEKLRTVLVYLLSLTLLVRSVFVFSTLHMYREHHGIYHPYRKYSVLDAWSYQEIVYNMLMFYFGICLLVVTFGSGHRNELSLLFRRNLAIVQVYVLSMVMLLEVCWLSLNDFMSRLKHYFDYVGLCLILPLCVILAVMGPSRVIFQAKSSSVFSHKLGPLKVLEFLSTAASVIFATGISWQFYSPIYDLSGPAFFIVDAVIWFLLVLSTIFQIIFRQKKSLLIAEYEENTLLPSDIDDIDNRAANDSDKEDRDNDQTPLLSTTSTRASRQPLYSRIFAKVKFMVLFIERELIPNLASIMFPAYAAVKATFFLKWSASMFLGDYINSLVVFAIVSICSALLAVYRLFDYLKACLMRRNHRQSSKTMSRETLICRTNFNARSPSLAISDNSSAESSDIRPKPKKWISLADE